VTGTQLLSPFSPTWIGDGSVKLSGISLDSRRVHPGDLFVAMQGQSTDGKRFVSQALQNGAKAILSEFPVQATVPVAVLKNLRENLGKISATLYQNPGEALTIIGVTGTNGKTTISVLIEQLLGLLGKKSGYIGTLGYRWGQTNLSADRTTPEATDLHRMLRAMVEEEVSHVAIECSSHGLELGRLNDLPLDVALFTNLTQDHLDFHSSMKAYEDSKRKLFDSILKSSPKAVKTAILNMDDPVGLKWSKEMSGNLITVSVENRNATIFADRVRMSPAGIEAEIGWNGKSFHLKSPLVGKHNLSNLLGALGITLALGFPMDEALTEISSISGIAGRLEKIDDAAGRNVFVDYAHTDDALENVLTAIAPFKKGKLIVVFGCGGDRDRSKRPKMARIVSKYADEIVITSDNPRSEDPQTIITEIEKGLPNSTRSKAQSIVDRREAIHHAIAIAGKNDLVLIAGKGHETTQEVKGKKFPFDDRLIAKEALTGGTV